VIPVAVAKIAQVMTVATASDPGDPGGRQVETLKSLPIRLARFDEVPHEDEERIEISSRCS